MNRSFSPQHNSPRSPANFSNRFRMPAGQQYQSPYNSNFHPRMQYGSPQSSPSFLHNHQYNQVQKNSFDLPSPKNSHFASPQFHSSPKVYSPRDRSPYESQNSSLNSSWNNQSNISMNSSSYFADTSGSPYSMTNQRQMHNKKNSSDGDSNPGHSFNIEDYVRPSMLEDPFENVMMQCEKEKEELNMEQLRFSD